ncbi:uncharacterized protein LOC117187190 [Drosophila miranda]|uniref:uncharacterized protein LOC117187190 n=1 Tax=Drosophila miranda TaxID=7229 RepID=UPI00143FB27B|nr:uncharacterized protein LOC117187190 [Drosophila miranda]
MTGNDGSGSGSSSSNNNFSSTSECCWPGLKCTIPCPGGTFCSCFHVFMAQIIAVINNNTEQSRAEQTRPGPRTQATRMMLGDKDELRDVDADADAISTEFCSINDKL